MRVWKPLNFVQYRHLRDLICEHCNYTSIRCQELLKDYICVASLNIWQFSLLYCMVSSIWTFRSVICRLRHGILTGVVGEFVAGVTYQNFSLSHICRLRHRILSGVVGEFVAGVAFQNCLRSQVMSTSTSDFVWGRRRVRRWCRHSELFA